MMDHSQFIDFVAHDVMVMDSSDGPYVSYHARFALENSDECFSLLLTVVVCYIRRIEREDDQQDFVSRKGTSLRNFSVSSVSEAHFGSGDFSTGTPDENVDGTVCRWVSVGVNEQCDFVDSDNAEDEDVHGENREENAEGIEEEEKDETAEETIKANVG